MYIFRQLNQFTKCHICCLYSLSLLRQGFVSETDFFFLSSVYSCQSCPTHATPAFCFLSPAVLPNLLTRSSTLSFLSRRSFAVFLSQPSLERGGLVTDRVWSLVCVCPDSELIQGVETSEFRLLLVSLNQPSGQSELPVQEDEMEEGSSCLLGSSLTLARLSCIINTHLRPQLSVSCHMVVFCHSSLALISDFVVSLVTSAPAENKRLIAPLFSLS